MKSAPKTFNLVELHKNELNKASAAGTEGTESLHDD